jgi:lipoyl-dependent peroxiredoxin
MKTILSRQATTYGGRNGIIKDTASKTELNMRKPEEMGGSPNKETNPEELFSMGYSACFASSIEYLLKNDKVSYEDIIVKVDTKLVMEEKEGFKFDVTIYPKITGVTKEIEKTYIDQAYGFCPYSKAIRDNVRVTIESEH